MSLFFRREMAGTADEVIARTTMGRGTSTSSPAAAMRMSAVWACRRLRADLISTMPVDVYRTLSDGRAVEIKTPPVLMSPDGRVDITEWMYSTQADLDGYGNSFGIIRAVSALGLPTAIDLVPVETVSVVANGNDLKGYRIGGQFYTPQQVWHERQFTSSGLLVGLSPLAYAAMSISSYLSAQQFAQDWFKGAGIPAARLKNTAKTITQSEAELVKSRFKSSVANGDLFVHGADWEYEMIAVKASESEFLSSMKFGISDICRFLGVPGDMIDAESSSGSITYANVTQRNLQLLILNLQPAISRRERALSRLTASPQFVKLNTDALLRMDPQGRALMNKTLIESRQRTPDEVRMKDDLMALTPEQIAKFAELFPAKSSAAVPGPEGVPA